MCVVVWVVWSLSINQGADVERTTRRRCHAVHREKNHKFEIIFQATDSPQPKEKPSSKKKVQTITMQAAALRTAARSSVRQHARSRRGRSMASATAESQSQLQQIKQWVITNQKQVGGGIVALFALKFMFGGEQEEIVDELYDQIKVTVPNGGRALEGYVMKREYAAGDMLSINNPHIPGTIFQVQIPKGKEQPGSSFVVKVPRCPKEMNIVVPEGMTSGSMMPIQHPGHPGSSFVVKIPEGKLHGDSFKIKLP